MNLRREGLDSPYFNHHEHTMRGGELITPRLAPGERPRHRHHPAVRAIASVALKTMLAAAIIDPVVAQYEAGLTEQQVVEVMPNLNEQSNESVINVSAGFGLRNSSDIAVALSPFSRQGEVWATIYDNKAIDGIELAGSLLKKANKDGITKLNLWGDSMGGMLSLEAAKIIQASDSDVVVPYVVLENSPSSLESIRPLRRENGQLLLSFTNIPFLSYSRVIQFGAGVAAKSGYYLGEGVNQTIPDLPFNLTELIATGFRVAGDMISGDNVPSAELLGSQFSTIATSDVRGNIMKLGEDNEHGKPKPVLVLIRPTSDYSDPLVNSRIIESEYRQYALEAGLRLIIIRMPGIHHGDPTMNRRQYADIIPYIIEQVEKTNNNPLNPGSVSYDIIYPGNELVSY